MTSEEYVDLSDGTYRVAGTRVSLASLVFQFLDGRSPESITQSFPVLTLEQVDGALAFYLAHRIDVDKALEVEGAVREEARTRSHATHKDLITQLRTARDRQNAAAS